jgi:hypothetical protein
VLSVLTYFLLLGCADLQQDAMLSDDVTVDAKLTADAERLAASIKVTATQSVSVQLPETKR